jgi:hypothetical protein
VANNWDKRRNDSAIRTLSLKELETYKAFPPSGPGSHNLDQVLEELKKTPVHPCQ